MKQSTSTTFVPPSARAYPEEIKLRLLRLDGGGAPQRALVAASDRGRGRRFLFGGGRFVFGRGGIRGIHLDVMFSDLLLKGNDICEIHRGRPSRRPLHEFQPDGKSRACAGFFFPEWNL